MEKSARSFLRPYDPFLDQRFSAALLAMSWRRSGVNLSALAFAPFSPPSFPSATERDFDHGPGCLWPAPRNLPNKLGERDGIARAFEPLRTHATIIAQPQHRRTTAFGSIHTFYGRRRAKSSACASLPLAVQAVELLVVQLGTEATAAGAGRGARQLCLANSVLASRCLETRFYVKLSRAQSMKTI